ncbi:hypothetical protein SNE35_18740 [Paucibacter sp. R3-3]|uniref:Uncharacterized protein n=1 Tax=Roseateles agri TaxID=3098619 RepID=A0ABU5DJT5_9BURK|nr:hypothetical protein [Paucibacter sp. R3-3]MDY0746558.1 hypothetical protein [Paucibacter sp. R3-3]
MTVELAESAARVQSAASIVSSFVTEANERGDGVDSQIGVDELMGTVFRQMFRVSVPPVTDRT